MRIRYPKLILFIFVINIFIIYHFWKLFGQANDLSEKKTIAPKSLRRPQPKHLSKLVTVIIREFEPQENDLTGTVSSILNLLPTVQIVIINEGLPYPPLSNSHKNISLSNLKLIDLSNNLDTPYLEAYPFTHVKTKYVLFVPDSARITNRQTILRMVYTLHNRTAALVAAPLDNRKDLKCFDLNVNSREWLIKYNKVNGDICDLVKEKHVILTETDLLISLNNPLMLPFPTSLYLQTAAKNLKVQIINNTFHAGKPVFKSHHAHWKQQQLQKEREKHLYISFNVKQVIREDDTVEWYGCKRDTARCFGPVIDLMPSYLYEGKWTPPCCLANLRKTALHVFSILDESGVRYWLESGSLLGAMRSGDILKWDYDVDIGFYRDDIPQCSWLQKAKSKPIVDKKGFVWEKATEGNFFRVVYSKSNRIFVNLFPFYNKNGTMAKDSWFTSHKNMEFPEQFLHPMSSIEFLGRYVPSPNNVRDFLEIKFGKGAIENPQYPQPSVLKFP